MTLEQSRLCLVEDLDHVDDKGTSLLVKLLFRWAKYFDENRDKLWCQPGHCRLVVLI